MNMQSKYIDTGLSFDWIVDVVNRFKGASVCVRCAISVFASAA